jgi:hypothetical protein
METAAAKRRLTRWQIMAALAEMPDVSGPLSQIRDDLKAAAKSFEPVRSLELDLLMPLRTVNCSPYP